MSDRNNFVFTLDEVRKKVVKILDDLEKGSISSEEASKLAQKLEKVIEEYEFAESGKGE